MDQLVDSLFWRDRSVLITGHTGFKGAWLALWLHAMGARVTGLADRVPTSPSLYELVRLGELVDEVRADVRDAATVDQAIAHTRPSVVLHLAAQPFVRRSFREPRDTFEINVMGTVNVLDAVRRAGGVEVVVAITSDKCYDNRQDASVPSRPFVEGDPMGGHDPYSSSKGCAELVVDTFRRSYSSPDGFRLASARAGNVIGGGDWGEDRLIPDIMRGAIAETPIPVRNPAAIRPWQHVLNPLSGYLRLAQALHEDTSAAGGWNFGPRPDDARPVRWIADRLSELWPGDGPFWAIDPGPHPHEAPVLALDSSKARDRLGWTPTWDLDETLEAIVAWYAALQRGAGMRATTLAQVDAFASACAAPR